MTNSAAKVVVSFLLFSFQAANAGQELISCTDKNTSSKISLSFDFNSKTFSTNGRTMRRAMPGDKSRRYDFNQTFPIYADGQLSTFPGYDPRGGEVCTILSLPIINPSPAEQAKTP